MSLSVAITRLASEVSENALKNAEAASSQRQMQEREVRMHGDGFLVTDMACMRKFEHIAHSLAFDFNPSLARIKDEATQLGLPQLQPE